MRGRDKSPGLSLSFRKKIGNGINRAPSNCQHMSILYSRKHSQAREFRLKNPQSMVCYGNLNIENNMGKNGSAALKWERF